jgi:F-type H+-transporting ATPase subunit c
MRKLQYLFMALAVLCFAVPVFAQSGAVAAPALSLIPIGAGLGMGLAAGLCGMGQGRAVGSACESLARNPGTRAGIMLFLVLGLAFIESLTLFTMVIVFVKM